MYGRPNPIIARLHVLLAEADLTLPSIAAAAELLNVSVSHLQHLLKENEGCCYGDLLRRERVRRARLILSSRPELSIENTAEALGCSAKTLYRDFKRECGASPADVRRAGGITSSL